MKSALGRGVVSMVAAAVAGTAAAAVAVPALPALAINGVACPAEDLNEFFQLTATNGTRYCYANAGATSIYIGYIRSVWSGNNRATLEWETSTGTYDDITLEKSQYYYLGSVTVGEIWIY